MARTLLDLLRRLLRLAPCYCGHAAAEHARPDACHPWYVCNECAWQIEQGGDWYSKRFALVAARHPYAVRG